MCFDILRITFETALKLRGGPSLVFAHSLGNNVFRYFLEWLKLEIAPKNYIKWLDEHIHAYFAVGMMVNFVSLIDLCLELCVFLLRGIFAWMDSGSPLLGSVETIKAALSGATFGLPVSEVSYFHHNHKFHVMCNMMQVVLLTVVIHVKLIYLKLKLFGSAFIIVICSH